MDSLIEILMDGRREWRPLDGDRVSIGRNASNHLPFPDDHRMSRLHAVLERLPAGWIVSDLSSRNGTWLNGSRLTSAAALKDGDEIVVGSVTLTFRETSHPENPTTLLSQGLTPPDLTKRERDVLVELCRPLNSEVPFAQPASTKGIAAALFISDAAVRQHLLTMYDKFDLHDERRTRETLAREALRRRAVTREDLR